VLRRIGLVMCRVSDAGPTMTLLLGLGPASVPPVDAATDPPVKPAG